MGKGTSLDDPVTVEQKPDLVASRHEIEEYLNANRAYDIFDFMLKELLTKQPADPLQHMLDCLQTPHPNGPLKVVVASPPGLGRRALAKRLADTFGIVHISAGELLAEAGVQTDDVGFADDEVVAKIVIQRLRQVNDSMQGWVLDGFPRTRFQTSFLKEGSFVPAHVLLLKATESYIFEKNAAVGEGELEGKYIKPEVLEHKLRLHSGQDSAALEVYSDRMSVIDGQLSDEQISAEMARIARMVPRSRGPQPPPRVVVLGPRGVGAREHATRLAARLGSVLVDAQNVQGSRLVEEQAPEVTRKQMAGSGTRPGFSASLTSMDLPDQERLISADPLGAVGLRLRQDDCLKQGWVLCGYPSDASGAAALQEETRLCPTRIVALVASQETCVDRLRSIQTDPVTGKVWTSLPRNEHIRKRLLRDPGNQPGAVRAAHSAFSSNLPSIFEAFGGDDRCQELPADGPPEKVFNSLAEFVERPLPLPM